MTAPETSIVVRTYNEARRLPALFEAFGQQRYTDFEVILVDSGSIDGSREIAAALGHRVIRISNHDFTFGYSLNVGIRVARGRFIAIVSAHTVPVDENWLARLVEPLRDADSAMVYGRQLGVRSSKFSEAEDFRRTFGEAPQVLRPPQFFANNANSAIRRDLWEQEPFDESLPGLEDIGWAKHWMERDHRVIYEPEAALYHIHEETWHQVRHRYYREAVAAHWIGVRSGWGAASEPFKEFGRAVTDLARSVRPGGNPAAQRLSVGARAREILQFRANKTYGTVRGLLDGAAMKSPAERQKFYFDDTSRAVVIHGANKASLDEVEVPELRPGEVLIRVAHVAVCATDLEIYSGRLGYYRNGMASYPITPGHEFSGHIAAVGTNVSKLSEGDAVVVECIQSCGVCAECAHGNHIGCPDRTEIGVFGRSGGYAEHAVAPARFVQKLAPGTDMRQAALIEPLAVNLKGLRRLFGGRPNGGSPGRCAVVGAGPLGHLCARILDLQGHRVRAFDRSPERLEFFTGTGVEVSESLEELADFPTVVEVTGNPEALDRVLHDSPAGADILLLGLPYAERRFSFENIAAYDKTVIGSVGSTGEDFSAAIRLLPELDLAAFTRHSAPLADYHKAWEMSRQPDVLKVMIDPRS